MIKKAALDWEAIERSYRIGVLSVREIGAAHGVSHTAINKRAKTFKWSRDLKAKVQARAEALVSKAEVSKLVSTKTAITEKLQVEATATLIADTQIGQRNHIGRCLALADKLMNELESVTDLRGDVADLVQRLKGDDVDGADALELAAKMSSLPSRMKSMKELAGISRTLIALQRQAYGMGEGSLEEPYEDRLARLLANA
ncbi:MAG TPA: hypothetical protein VF671_13385 [Pseudomonas sp.]|jgi:hypothetical protein|uniref:hypothetical protein n=1 Tax=Pseudomonas sp. TaxID=306 RepID=UPI002ED8EAA1